MLEPPQSCWVHLHFVQNSVTKQTNIVDRSKNSKQVAATKTLLQTNRDNGSKLRITAQN